MAVTFLKKLPTHSFKTFSFADETAIQTSQTSHQPQSQTNLQRSTRPPSMSQIGRQPRIFPSKVQPKNLANIKFHAYYLEGGWGYVIVFCALLANILNQGTLFSTSIVASIADRRFRIGGGPQFGVYSGGKRGPRFHSICDFRLQFCEKPSFFTQDTFLLEILLFKSMSTCSLLGKCSLN